MMHRTAGWLARERPAVEGTPARGGSKAWQPRPACLAACLAASRQEAGRLLAWQQAGRQQGRQGRQQVGRAAQPRGAGKHSSRHGSRHGSMAAAAGMALQAWHCSGHCSGHGSGHGRGAATALRWSPDSQPATALVPRHPPTTPGASDMQAAGDDPGARMGEQVRRERALTLERPRAAAKATDNADQRYAPPPPKPYQPQAGRVSGRRPPVPHGGADRLLATGRAGGGGAASTGGAWRGRGLQGCKERRQWDTPADNRRARRCRGAERSSEKERPARPGVKDGGDGQRGARQTSGCMYRIAAAASSATRGSEPTTRRNLPRREFELAATHEDRKVDNRQRTSARKQKGRAAPGWQPPDHPRGPELEGGGGGSGGLGYQI